MNIINNIFIKLLVLLFFFSMLNLAKGNPLTPKDTVKATTEEVITRVEMDIDKLKLDPSYIQVIVYDLIVPHFDFNTMAKLVLERNYSKMDESQIECFTLAFKNLLVTRYADIFITYGEHQIIYESEKKIGDKDYVSVRQIIMYEGVGPVHVDYRMRPVQSGWKVVDLSIEEVSLLKNYRVSFLNEIKEEGLQKFLNKFEECN